MTIKIGIYGGVFNPPTYLHLRTAEQARERMNFEKIYWEPVNDSYVKEEMIPSQYRLEMLKLALQDNKYFELGMYECGRHGFCHTIDTLRYYERKLSLEYNQPVKLYFIMGSDVLKSITTWVGCGEILRNYKLVVINRLNDNTEEIIEENDVLYTYRHNIISIYEPILNTVSSTKVRRLIRRGGSVKYLIPHEIEEYIYKNRLYSSPYFDRNEEAVN